MKKKSRKIIKVLFYGIALFLIFRLSYKLINPLYRAYILSSEEKMELFFQNWNRKYSSNYSQIKNDTIRQIYDVFDVFYTPRDLNRIGESEWGDSIYVNSKLLLIQDWIEYSIHKSNAYFDSVYHDSYVFLNKNDSVPYSALIMVDSTIYSELMYQVKNEEARRNIRMLEDFRPKTIYESSEIIYNNRKFNKQINQYLGKGHIDFGVSNIMSTAIPRKSNQNKQEFMNPYIIVWHGHWGGYWHLFSHPLVTEITFENDLKTAYISYRVVYQFGIATLKKIDNQWTLIDSDMTGIE